MRRINKIDYFVGVFLSTILSSSKGIPALFDEGYLAPYWVWRKTYNML